jgi:hypothetical protein
LNVLDRFAALGVRFRLDGTRPIAVLPWDASGGLRAELAAARDHVLAELLALEDRRQRVMRLLEQDPSRHYAVVYDPDANTKYAVLIIAIPGATCEVRVTKPADSWEFMSRLIGAVDALPRGEGGVRA